MKILFEFFGTPRVAQILESLFAHLRGNTSKQCVNELQRKLTNRNGNKHVVLLWESIYISFRVIIMQIERQEKISQIVYVLDGIGKENGSSDKECIYLLRNHF